MYKIVGADGREYGPVTAEDLGEWIRQGRVTGRTLAQFEDGPWQPLSGFPQFSAALAATGTASPIPSSSETAATPSQALILTKEPAGLSDATPDMGSSSAAYHMRGADGREYGPASFDQMRAWILENRAGAQTFVRREGSVEWLPLSMYPEFATFLPYSQPVARPAITADQDAGPRMDPHLLSEHIRGRDYRVAIGESFRRGFDLVKANFGLILAAEIICFGIAIALSVLLEMVLPTRTLTTTPSGFPEVTQLLTIMLVSVPETIINSLLTAGFLSLIINLARGYRPSLSIVFIGFSRLAGPIIVLEIVRTFLMALGFLACILPGLYLAVAWAFALPLLLDRRYSFWDSLEVSRKVVTTHWFQVFIFGICASLFALLGAVACLVGLLFTIPVAAAAYVYVYEDIFDVDRPTY